MRGAAVACVKEIGSFFNGHKQWVCAGLLILLAPATGKGATFVNDTFSTDTRSQYNQLSENSGNTVYSDESFNFLSSDGMISLRMHRKNNGSTLNYGTRLREANLTKFPFSATSSASVILTLGNSTNVPKIGGTETVNVAAPLTGTGSAGIRFGIIPSLSSYLNTTNVICVQVTATTTKVNVSLRVANTVITSADVNNGNGWANGDQVILSVQAGKATVQYIDQSTGTTYTPLSLVTLTGVSFSAYLNGAYGAFDIGNSSGISPGQEFNIPLVLTAFRVDSDIIQPPSGVTVLETSETAAQVTWNASSTAASYEVLRDGAVIGTATGLSYTDSGPLDKYRSYEYTVKAVDASSQKSSASPAYVFAYRRFPFVMPYSVTLDGSVTDMSTWSPGPASNRISVSGGHLYASGQPIKLLGVNMVFNANFPSQTDPTYGDLAEKVAARMAKLGINAVRFHALDRTTPSGLYNSAGTGLDAAQMTKFDYFVSRLKAHGIYADLNLTVNQGYPGFSKVNFPSSNFKGVDIYMPGMIQRQKDFANALLNHTNSYTGYKYSADPCVAFVEINNENGLIYQWRKGLFGLAIDSGYLTELKSQWNTWLSAKYANTAALVSAWSPAAGTSYGTELIANGDFTSAFAAPWYVQVVSPAVATYQVVSGGAPDTGNALRINVTTAAPSSESYKVQTYCTNFGMEAGKSYTAKFWARSDTPRTVTARFLRNHTPWGALGSTSVNLTNEWRQYTAVLVATDTDSATRFEITGLGSQTGIVEIAHVSVQTGNALLGPGSAYAEGATGASLLTNGDFSSAFASPWQFQVISPAAATQTIVSGGGPNGLNALEINVTTPDTANTWHVQAYQTGLSTQNGRSYILSFWAKADTARTVSTHLLRSVSPYGNVTNNVNLQVGTNWQLYTVVLVANATESSARLDLSNLGGVAGKISFAGVSLTSGMLTNGNFSSSFASPWNFQVISPAAATQTVVTGGGPTGQNALEINVTTADTANIWHVQAYQTGLSTQSGQPYTLTFWAKADTARTVTTRLLKSVSPYGAVTNDLTLQVGTSWQQYTVVLVANATESSVRLDLTNLGGVAGKISFADFSLNTGTPGVGLPAGESLGSVNILSAQDSSMRNRAVQKDWYQFLWDTENTYWTTMRDYVKNTLGNQSLLIGTQTEFSPALIQAQLDVVDQHAYWQHPSFPGTAWDPNNWYVKNVPMAGASSGVTFARVSPTRVTGKPFVCTEYNHASPNTYVGETFLLAAAQAALQGWDAVFAYNYLHTTEWDTGFFDGWFQISQEPSKLVSLGQASAMMRSGGVSAGTQQGTATISADDAVMLSGVGYQPFGLGSLGVDVMQSLSHPLGVASGSVTLISMPYAPASQTSYVSDTGELEWDTTDGLMTANTTKVKTIVGKTGQQLFDFGDGVKIQPSATMQSGDWAAISLMVKSGSGFSSLGSQFLLTATGYADNHKMTWKSGMGPADATSSVGTQWGQSPTLLEGITATVTLPVPSSKVTVWALDESGNRVTAVPVTGTSSAIFTIHRNYETVWYEIVVAP